MKGKDLKKFFDTVAVYGGMPVNKEVRLIISDNTVRSLTIKGKEVDDDQTYTIATIDYLTDTEDYFNAHISRKDYDILVWEYYTEYFRYLSEQNNGEITASKDGRIIVE